MPGSLHMLTGLLFTAAAAAAAAADRLLLHLSRSVIMPWETFLGESVA
jgi:hypothetical protein